jgi:phospholipase/carboxylesterase
MTRMLNYGRTPPRSGAARSMVVFLHGYGADGADLLDLGDVLGPHLPDTVFLAPDAPDPCAGNPFGRQWFPIPAFDGSSEAEARAAMLRSAADLNAFLDARLAEEGLAPADLALFGFSQGTMMALEIAPRRAELIAGIVAFSGRLIRPELLAAEVRVKPPVLLIHGDADPMVPFAEMQAAGAALSAAGFETYAHIMRGTAHGIAPDGLSVALAFLKDRLGA